MKKLKMVSIPESEWLDRISKLAVQTFHSALELAAKIRFIEDFYIEDGEYERGVKVPPRNISICHPKTCDAGTGCCHKFVKKNIPFCVY